MSWRLRRQIIYLGSIFALLFLVFFFFYKASQKPSCFDGKQNQGEEGVDCGGPCPLDCEVKNLLLPKTNVLPPIIYSRTIDLIGLVENPNNKWALNDALATFYIYDKLARLKNKVTVGKIAILPREVRYVVAVSLSKPNYDIGKIELKLDYGLNNWQKSKIEKMPLEVVNQKIEYDKNVFSGSISNPTKEHFRNIEIIVRFYDEGRKLVGVTYGRIDLIPPKESVPFALTLPPVENIYDAETSIHFLSL
jgi:hypothetical protein